MAPSRAVARLATVPRRVAQHQQRFIHGPVLRRSYYSHDHPQPQSIYNPAEEAILSAAYCHVPEHGFTQRALSLGARDAGYLDISTNLLPEGPFSLIRYHLVTQRNALAPRSKEIFNANATGEEGAAPTSVQIPDKVERLTWERLLANQDVNHRWQEVSLGTHTSIATPRSLASMANA